MSNFLAALWARIKRWHEGVFVPPKNNPSSQFFFVMGHYDRHWSARAVDRLGQFWLDHWQWIVTTSIAVAGLLFLKLR